MWYLCFLKSLIVPASWLWWRHPIGLRAVTRFSSFLQGARAETTQVSRHLTVGDGTEEENRTAKSWNNNGVQRVHQKFSSSSSPRTNRLALSPLAIFYDDDSMSTSTILRCHFIFQVLYFVSYSILIFISKTFHIFHIFGDRGKQKPISAARRKTCKAWQWRISFGMEGIGKWAKERGGVC